MMQTYGMIIGKRGRDYETLARHPDLPAAIAGHIDRLHRSAQWRPSVVASAVPAVVGGQHLDDGTLLLRFSTQGQDAEGRQWMIHLEALWIPGHRCEFAHAASGLWQAVRDDGHGAPSLNHLAPADLGPAASVSSPLWLDRGDLLRIAGMLDGPAMPPPPGHGPPSRPRPQVRSSPAMAHATGSVMPVLVIVGTLALLGLGWWGWTQHQTAQSRGASLQRWEHMSHDLALEPDPDQVWQAFTAATQERDEWRNEVGRLVDGDCVDDTRAKITALIDRNAAWLAVAQRTLDQDGPLTPEQLRQHIDRRHQQYRDLEASLDASDDQRQQQIRQLLKERDLLQTVLMTAQNKILAMQKAMNAACDEVVTEIGRHLQRAAPIPEQSGSDAVPTESRRH